MIMQKGCPPRWRTSRSTSRDRPSTAYRWVNAPGPTSRRLPWRILSRASAYRNTSYVISAQVVAATSAEARTRYREVPDEGDCGDGRGCGNGWDDAGGAARAAGGAGRGG